MDMFKKRAGTSGISGQLYETKLISLILFRLLHDESIEEFYLASNMDDIGAFDDICCRLKIAGHERSILIFVQAKHKDDEHTFLNFDLIQNVNTSFVKVKQNFRGSKDVFFNGKFDETDCIFILYTNAKYNNKSNIETPLSQTRKPYKNKLADTLNGLIGTGDEDSQGSQVDYTGEDLEFINEKILEDEIATLAEHFAKFLTDKSNQSMNIMLDTYIQRYHVILATNIVDISDVKSEENKPIHWRELTFRQNFFCTDDVILAKFRKHAYELVVRYQAFNKNTSEVKQITKIRNDTALSRNSCTRLDPATVDNVIKSFFADPSAITLSPLIGTYIVNKNGKLKFTVARPDSDVQALEQIDISQSTIDEAVATAARNILVPLKLKVPVTFGNLDMTIGGNPRKVEKRLNTLTDFIVNLCEKSEFVDTFKVVTIDEGVGEGFLGLNNGIGGAIGNLLIYDDVTKLLKFTERCALLQNNARTLYYKLNSNIDSLHSYRFNVKPIITFPRLVFDYTDHARQIFEKILIYERQGNHNMVEAILKREVEHHQMANGPRNFPIGIDTLITCYHNEIQKWWMDSKMARYFTKFNNVYQQALNYIITEPQICAMDTTFSMNNIKYFRYEFNENALESLASLEMNSRTIIVTDIITLTTMKVLQCLRNKNRHSVLDLECIINLPIEKISVLISDVKKTEKILIIVCESTKSCRALYKRLDELTQATEKKRIIVITNNVFLETIQDYFPCENVLHERQSLIDLTAGSQSNLIRNARVIFQGQEIRLGSLIDDVSVTFIKGAVLNKIVQNETLVIGKSLTNSRYDEIKHLYVDRRVCQATKENMDSSNDDVLKESKGNIRILRTFQDINDNVVLITAKPGMGKSTLLTHLSLKTNERDRTLWILRINLLDYSRIFHDWKVKKIVINILETLKFMCQFVINNYDFQIKLKEYNGKVYLDGDTGNDWDFDLNLFLHFYNEKSLFFLFDGFDEICPLYKDSVIDFFNIVMSYPRQHKMWVTSRPYSAILPDLQRTLGKSYVIEYINESEQKIYLIKYWQDKLVIAKLNEVQLNNVLSFIDFMRRQQDSHLEKISYIFYDYVYSYFPHIEYKKYSNIDKFVLVPNFSDIRHGLVNQPNCNIMGTPLLLYLYADYFVSLICEKEITNWNSKIKYSPLTVYEIFIQTKLKKILYQDKNKMDIYKPDINRRYEKELVDCVAMHKKFAAHALLFHKINLAELNEISPFYNNFEEYEDAINKIKIGTDKTGLISHITVENIPVFIYRTLTEYFAAEFVCDIFKSDNFDIRQKNFLYTIAYMTYDIFSWINKKREEDGELADIIKGIELMRDPAVDCYGYFFATGWPIEHIVRIRSSLREDYENDCFSEYNDDFTKFLRRIAPEHRDAHIKQFQKNVIQKMKPNLRKYFVLFPGGDL